MRGAVLVSVLLFGLLAAGLLFSCAGQDHDLKARGFLVYLNSFYPKTDLTRYQHERIVDKTIDLMSAIAPDEYPADALYSALESWDGQHFISWHSQPFNCAGSASGKCYGTHLLGDINVSKLPCMARTALAHELLHFFNYAVQEYSDSKHQDERFFAMACTQKDDTERVACIWETVEWNVSYELAKELCPEEETYVRLNYQNSEALTPCEALD